MDFQGKAAVITGGASGIGLATAEALAARGAIPVLLDIEATASGRRAVRLEMFGDLVANRVTDGQGRELFHFRAGEELVVYHRELDSAMFYTDRHIGKVDLDPEVDEFLSRPQRVFFIIERKRLPKLEPFEGRYWIVAEHANKVIVSNRPGALE